MPFVLYKCSTTNQEKGYIMRCNTVSAVNYSSLGKSNFAFKGVNDVDPSKSECYTIDKSTMYCPDGANYSKKYNSYGDILFNNVNVIGGRGFDRGRCEYWTYYDDRTLKSHLEKQSYDSDAYVYREYRHDGSLYKKVCNNQDFVYEDIYNDGKNIGKKTVIKPGILEDKSCNTIELLYKKENSQAPYRVLGKDYWGNLLKDITDKAKLLKTKIVGNKVLFKK